MSIRRRHHSHSRKEWEEIRPSFTELYQVQGKKLSEIVDILARQGFIAKECHYKTYIRKWHLDRKNKESDMVFAHQKLQDRQKKDTSFIIRGQIRHRRDIEHYWKRREVDPAQFSPIAQTPADVEYRTPSPPLGEEDTAADLAKVSQTRSKRTSRPPVKCLTCYIRRVNCDGRRPECLCCQKTGRKCAGYEDPLPTSTRPRRSESYLASEKQAVLAESTTGQIVWSSETSYKMADNITACFDFSTPQRDLSPLEPYASQEQALHHVKVYFQSYVERADREIYSSLWQKEFTAVDRFTGKALDILAAIRMGLSQNSVDAARLDMFTLLPDIAKCEHPFLMTMLLDMIGRIATAARQTRIKAISMLNREIVGTIARLRIGSHPVVLALQATDRLSDVAGEVSERLLVASKDILAQGIGYEHYETRRLLFVTSIASENCGRLSASLKYAQDLYRIELSRHRTAATDSSLFSLLSSQDRLILCHLTFAHFDEAQKLVTDGLASCCHFTTRLSRDDYRSRYLHFQGVVKWHCGQPALAAQFFAEALNLRWPLFGAGEHHTMVIANWLQHVLRSLKQKPTANVPQVVDEEEFPALEHEGHIVAEDEVMVDYEAGPTFEEATMSMIVGDPEDFGVAAASLRATAPMTEVHDQPHDLHGFEKWAEEPEETWNESDDHIEGFTGERSNMMDLL